MTQRKERNHPSKRSRSAHRPPPRIRRSPPVGRKGTSVAALEARLLDPRTVGLLERLSRRFDGARRKLLADRPKFHERIAAGKLPVFPSDTRPMRATEWTVAAPPPDLTDRRVEITGPTDRKMVIHALNSGARVYMADFEDAHAPTWRGTLEGQANLIDAVRGTISAPGSDGRRLLLAHPHATLMVRPRGWHLLEEHFRVEGAPISASLFDFGVFFSHNARELLARGTGPYFYLPKLEHGPEAGLWSEVFDFAEDWAGIERGSIRATVLIETLPAIFEAEEILYALRKHSAGLNCGRWDYIFSFIKQFRDDPNAVFPDRGQLGMTVPFLDAYARHLIRVCHRRGAHAMGGMAPQIPIKGDPEANAEAIGLVVADKEREVTLGHDGTWVAHPGLVPVATQVFDRAMPSPNQIHRPIDGASVTPAELLAIPVGRVTRPGVRTNVHVALRYLDSWLGGVGCVPIDHRMEDAATIEIARSQLWQWVRHRATLADGGAVTAELVRDEIRGEAGRIAEERGAAHDGRLERRLKVASALLDDLATSEAFTEFFTLLAYSHLGGGGLPR